MTSQFSEIAKSHLRFLRQVHIGILKASKGNIDLYLEKAAERYWYIWFNGVMKTHLRSAENCDDLAAPLDIAWMWHVHTLSPEEYLKASNVVFGKPADRTTDPFHSAKDKPPHEVKRTVELWRISTLNDKFVLRSPSQKTRVKMVASDKPFLEKLKKGAKSQLEFLYQIDRPQYDNDEFIKESEARYWKFIKLISSSNSQNFFAVPTYDIDFIWHTHMSCTKSYRECCTKVAGFLINHDFSNTDRGNDSKLTKCFRDTAYAYELKYNEKLEKDNCMYRGATPATFFVVAAVPLFAGLWCLSSPLDWNSGLSYYNNHEYYNSSYYQRDHTYGIHSEHGHGYGGGYDGGGACAGGYGDGDGGGFGFGGGDGGFSGGDSGGGSGGCGGGGGGGGE
jgi:hypothetical protein